MRGVFIRQLGAALRNLILVTVVLGVAYPLAITAFAHLAAEDRADGSLVEVDGRPVGSELIGQPFTRVEYFHPRPSAVDYDAAGSGGSNLGPTSPELLDSVVERVSAYRRLNALPADAPVPVDAVTASASGLDPHISPANARLQAPRVAAARGLPVDVVLELVEEHIDNRPLGFLGDDAVNVLELNIALGGVTEG
jgi:potassium-transporting ATPase KdpC subunit